jgi:alpha-D-ribose 1-methylphosphonate 5-triphosphate synthase subunit PhnG
MNSCAEFMENAVDSAARSHWIATLAKAPLDSLERYLATLESLPTYQFLRAPETGLAMVQGRAEGTGKPFNLGEITLTRCVVQIAHPNGETIAGFGYVAGRSHRHAEVAALCDALLQHPDWHDIVRHQIIAPLQAERQPDVSNWPPKSRPLRSISLR